MLKAHASKGYNWSFNTETGVFKRWGDELVEDPQFSPVGPEILDIEVSTVCHQGCKFCYKSNLPAGKNMSFKDFKIILDKMKSNLTQVAFGIGDLFANTELYKMISYCKENNVIPNITINGFGLTNYWVNYLSTNCGAVSVSNYDKIACYNSVDRLTKAGLKQVNIHQLLSNETLSQCMNLIKDAKEDWRLKKLNAIVFLSLKQKGRGVTFSPIDFINFEALVNELFKAKIGFGFDSCTANKFLKYVKIHPEYNELLEYIEPCESGLFSSYINVEGKFYPCSFAEKGEGLDVLHCKSFLDDIWYNGEVISWRNNLLACKRNCPIYLI